MREIKSIFKKYKRIITKIQASRSIEEDREIGSRMGSTYAVINHY